MSNSLSRFFNLMIECTVPELLKIIYLYIVHSRAALEELIISAFDISDIYLETRKKTNKFIQLLQKRVWEDNKFFYPKIT